MRTTQEIVAHYRARKNKDLLGFTAEVLLPYLPVENVREFCKPDADLAEWKPDDLSEEGVLSEMRKYMEFAWGKVQGHRGISANRSVEKMEAWAWLLGRDDVVEAVGAADYAQYGAPKLKAVCDRLEFPVPDGTDIARMIEGQPCFEGCQEGCDR